MGRGDEHLQLQNMVLQLIPYLSIVGPRQGGRWFRGVLDDTSQINCGAFVDEQVGASINLRNWFWNVCEKNHRRVK